MPPRAYLGQAVKVHQPRSTGGTSAPRSAAGGAHVGAAHGFQRGVGAAQQVGKPDPPPKPAPAKTPSIPPWDSRYEQRVGGANRRYLDTTGSLDLAAKGVDQEFGLAPNFNNYQSNPFSRAALLESEFQKSNRGTMNSAGLQLYSGSTGNRLAQNRLGYDINRDRLAKTYRDAKQEIADTIGDAAWERVTNAEAAPLDPTQAPGAKKKKDKKKKDKKPPEYLAGVGKGHSLGKGKKRR